MTTLPAKSQARDHPSVQIAGLVKIFGKFKALDQLDLTVEPGSVFGFLGPNGAGKTTTIRILTGLAHATSGQAWVAGESVTGNGRAVARRIGHLPEEPAFYPWMTPGEFLDYVGRVFGMPGIERKQRVKELLGLVDLTGANKRRIGGFSRGMRQRLGLAQALINHPEVLFLDEPASALDPAGRKEVLELIEQLRGQCTVFMSTHILADVERVCDTVGIINKGRMVVTAPRQELLARYVIPAFEITADPAGDANFTHWCNQLQSEPWIKTIARQGHSARVVVTDLEIAKRALLPSAVQAGLILTRFEIVQPSLEDVFLQLVGQEANPL
jgi:ABC-2 type transport system ATP-binding protein